MQVKNIFKNTFTHNIKRFDQLRNSRSSIFQNNITFQILEGKELVNV